MFVNYSCAQSPPPTATGPVDIQANEQEFADKMVVAKGNVVVTYKDSVITGPEVKLFRDDAGQPQKAIFDGQPHLVQNDSKINADTLIFEIANNKFIAQGNAHSEVVTSGDNDFDPKAAPGKQKEKKEVKKEIAISPAVPAPATKSTLTKSTATASTKKAATNSKQPFAWPKAGDEPAESQPISVISKATDTDTPHTSKAKPSSGKLGEVEKIITDSDYQEYEKDTGKFDCTGHVHVLHGAVSVFSDKLRLVYGINGKPETALFTGHVDAIQDGNNTKAEQVTYYLTSKRLQATGNVRSRMIQQKPNDPAQNKKSISANPNNPASPGAATAAPAQTGATTADDSIYVLSDAQDFNQITGKMDADGNVKVYYQDTVALGPKAMLFRNPEGKAEKVIFTGRSQVSQSGKRWIADRITMAVASKKIWAEGNTKALIISSPNSNKPKVPPEKNTALAARTVKSGTAIGSSKIEATQ